MHEQKALKTEKNYEFSPSAIIMVDSVSAKKRSQMMAAIRCRDTRPEMIIRKGLHRKGYRFRLHNKDLYGKPDLVFPKYKAVCFVHGCFWHGHENCHLYRLPKSKVDFWKQKIRDNKTRDHVNTEKLLSSGWRVCIIWECGLKGKTKLNLEKLLDEVSKWIESDEAFLQVTGFFI